MTRRERKRRKPEPYKRSDTVFDNPGLIEVQQHLKPRLANAWVLPKGARKSK